MTNCIINFFAPGINASVYRNSDGHPDVAGIDIRRFLREVDENLKDKRFNDPEYLAAKYVVWLAKNATQPDTHYLDFLGVGVSPDEEDVEFVYTVHCNPKGGELPRVTCLWAGNNSSIDVPNLD